MIPPLFSSRSQSGVDQLIVEALDGPERPPAKLRTNLQMMGLDMSKGTLLVYDGSRADLYRVRVTGSSGDQMGTAPSVY